MSKQFDERIEGLNFANIDILVTTLEDNKVKLESNVLGEEIAYYKRGLHLYACMSDKWMTRNSYHDCASKFWLELGQVMKSMYPELRLRKIVPVLEVESLIADRNAEDCYLLEVSCLDFYINTWFGDGYTKVYIRPTASSFTGWVPDYNKSSVSKHKSITALLC